MILTIEKALILYNINIQVENLYFLEYVNHLHCLFGKWDRYGIS